MRAVTLLKKRLWRRCIPVNFVKYFIPPFLKKTSSVCFWIVLVNVVLSKRSTSPLFLCEFRESFYKSYFTEHQWTAASDIARWCFQMTFRFISSTSQILWNINFLNIFRLRRFNALKAVAKVSQNKWMSMSWKICFKS